MTSNLGARHLQKRTAMGFQSGADEAGQKSMEDMVMNEVKRAFNPEFLNRLDEVIIFNPLGDEDLLRIIDLLVGQLNDTLIHRQVQIVVSPEARQWILEKTCADRSYGARPLRRALQKYVEDPLSEALIQGGIQRPATLQIYVAGKAFRSVPSVRQPRSSTSESEPTHGWSRQGSGSTHGRPTPGPAGEKQLEFGGAALMTSLAAQEESVRRLAFSRLA